VFGGLMISRKKKVSKRKPIRKISAKRRNPEINTDKIYSLRMINYSDLIKGYSNEFDDAVREVLDENDITWGGSSSTIVSAKDLLKMLNDYPFDDYTLEECEEFEKEAKKYKDLVICF
jgi:hypothetical protein